jgi:ketosteroid isomerase-like protein
MTTADTLHAIYDAFARGDVAGILDRIAPDCAWEAWEDNRAQRAGLPIVQPRTGPAGAAEFFATVAGMEIHEFRVLDVLASERQAAAEVVIEATPPDGRRFRDEELHLWSFDADGRVTRMRHYVDTVKHIEAWSAPASAPA